eukprot:CAMPEP_0184334000 /NCGR_PEP_ID=MMETSP1089-20130417/2922_1 /TAXON_ID=38269 ORGANISM="Gloeochaete wittrockiana, Strain SAG46.84" /NCGR_SAMPLE_ID=MMETSP1089 /ASSEMBLY_ACC=CAM_ASM_000445 /LENGTH=2188 /DNA_ID=CAMNT_0026658119 /DNA_START=108 /DNA_END=6674 /DNA_ORIENTATION=-
MTRTAVFAALVLLCCLASGAFAKHTLHVDNIYPATNDFVRVNRADIQNGDIGELDVGALKVNSEDGFQASTTDSIDLQGAYVNFDSTDSINFNGEPGSSATVRAGPVLNFKNDHFETTSAGDIDLNSFGGLLKFVSTGDINGEFSEDVSFDGTADFEIQSFEGDISLASTNDATIRSSVSKIFATNGYAVDVQNDNLQISAKQTLDTLAIGTILRADDNLFVEVRRNNLLFDASEAITGNFDALNIAGDEYVLIGSPQGSVNLQSFSGDVTTSSADLLLNSHREISVTARSNDIAFSATGDLTVSADHGAVLEATTSDVDFNTQTFQVIARRLVLNHDGDLVFGSTTVNVGGGDTLSITSDGTSHFESKNQNIFIKGTNGVYVNSGDDIFIGRDSNTLSAIPNVPLTFSAGKDFTLSGDRSTTIQTSTLSIPSSNNIRLKNDYDPSNLFNLASTTTFTASASNDLNIYGKLQYSSTTLTVKSTTTDVNFGPIGVQFPDPSTIPSSVTFNSNFIALTSQDTSFSGGKIDTTSNSILQIYGDSSFSVNAGLNPYTLSILAAQDITVSTPDDIIFTASNFGVFASDLEFQSPKFVLTTQSADFVTQGDFSWSAQDTFTTNWNSELSFTGLSSFVASASNGVIYIGSPTTDTIRYLGTWDFSAPSKNIDLSYRSYFWQTNNYQDISATPDNLFKVVAQNSINFHGRDLTLTTPSLTTKASDTTSITSEFEKDLSISATNRINYTPTTSADFYSDRDLIFRTNDFTSIQNTDTYSTNRFVVRTDLFDINAITKIDLTSTGNFNVSSSTVTNVVAPTITLTASTVTHGAYFDSHHIKFAATTFDVTSAESIDITTNIGDITVNSSGKNIFDTTLFAVTGGDVEITSPFINAFSELSTFTSRVSDIVFDSAVSTSVLSTSFNTESFNNVFHTDSSLSFSAILTLAANAESVLIESGPLILQANDLTVTSNNDVKLNAQGNLVINAFSANADTNAIKVFATSQDAGVSFLSSGAISVSADTEIHINAGDLARGGANVEITSFSGAANFATEDPSGGYSLGAIIAAGGTRYDFVLGLPYGQLYRAQAGDINLLSQGGSAIFEAFEGDFTVTGNAGFSFKSNDVGSISVSGTVESNSNGLTEFTTDGTFDLQANSAIKFRSDGKISSTAGVSYLATAVDTILFSTEDGPISFSTESGNLDVVSGNDIDLRATEDISINNFGTLGDFSVSSGSILAFDAEQGFSLSAFSGVPLGVANIATSLFSLKSSTNGDITLSTGSNIQTVGKAQTFATGGGFALTAGTNIGVNSTTSEISFINDGSFEAFALQNVNLLSASGQTYTADNAIRVNPQTQITVLDAVVNIFAGGDSITKGVYSDVQGDVTITALTDQIKYTAETFSQYSKTASSYEVTTGPMQFQATGTPGLANLVTIAARDSVLLSGVDTTFGQSRFIELESQNQLLVESVNNIELDSARLFNLDAERELQVNAGAYWTMAATGKLAYTTFDDTFVDGVLGLDFIADTTTVFTSKRQLDVVQLSVGFGQTIATLGTNAAITFSTLSGDSRIALEPLSSSLFMDALNGKITYNVQFESVFRAPSANVKFTTADETRFTAGRVIDIISSGPNNGDGLTLSATDDIEITAKEPSSIIFGFLESATFDVSDGSAAFQPDGDFIINSRLVTINSAANAFLESGNDFVVQTNGAKISSGARLDFVTHGNALFSADTSADERFGIRLGGNNFFASSTKNVNIESQNSVLVNSGAFTTLDITQQLAFTANGTRGISVSALHDNYFKADTIAINAPAGEVAFVTYGQDTPNGYQLHQSTGSIDFTSGNLASFTVASGISMVSEVVSLLTSTAGTITLEATGRDSKDAGVEIVSLGYVNLFSNNGSVALVGDNVNFNVEARASATDIYSISRFSSLSIKESGVQAGEIQMVAFGSNENGNGIQISSYDPNTDIIISAEQRGVASFDSGSLLVFEGAHGAELAAFDDQIVTSFGPINIAGAGRSFIDDRDASIELVATNPEGQPGLGSNIEFISYDNVTMYTADVLLNQAANLLVFEGGDAASFVIQSSTGFNIDSPNQAFSATSVANFLISANTIHVSSFTGIFIAATNTISFNAADEFIVQASPYDDTLSLQAIFFDAPLINVSTDVFEVSNDSDFVITSQGAACSAVGSLTFGATSATICTPTGFRTANFNSAI